MEPDTGDFIWSYTTEDIIWGTPAVADYKVYICSRSHDIFCFGYEEMPDLHIDFISTGIGVDAVITNNGIVDATDVVWQIHVEGGLFGLIDTTADGTIDVPMGQTRTVSTGLFLGLDPFTVTAKADDVEKTGAGLILLFFILEVT